MKFTCSVDINLPVDRVIELFDDENNLKHWQDGFESFTHISGEPGTPGAKSRIHFSHRGKTMELIETIIVRDLPREFSATYEHKHMTNTMKNTFSSISDDVTRYDAFIEYTQFNGFMPNLMAKLFPGMFRKQTQKWLDQFKTFAESQGLK